MTKTTDYIIVSSKFHVSKTTHEDLTDTVRQKLKEGYEPLGSPFISGELMYQAMVRIDQGSTDTRPRTIPASARTAVSPTPLSKAPTETPVAGRIG